VATGKELLTLRGHSDAVGALAFAPDCKTLASGSNDGAVKLWDVATGRERATLLNPFFAGRPEKGRFRVESLAFTPDGRTLASGSYDGRIRLWDVAPPVGRRR
jgi:WD40 repeat protein